MKTETEYISVRPTRELMSAFLYADAQEISDRTTLFNQAMRYIVESNRVEILLQAAEEKIELDETRAIPSSFKVRIDDEEVFRRALQLFREAFHVQRVQMRFFIIVVLKAYGINLRRRMPIENVNSMVKFGIDAFVFKQEYELSKAAKKEELYEWSRRYLEVVPELENKIRKQVEEQIRGISDYYNPQKYFPPKCRNFGGTNIIYISKVYAGLLLIWCEINGKDIDEALSGLKEAVLTKSALDQ